MHQCQALRILSQKRCWEPADGLYHVGCLHEHVQDMWLCSTHATSIVGRCNKCYNADGHNCSLVVTPVDEAIPL